MRVEVTRDTISDDVTATATLQDGGAKLTLTCEPDDYEGVRVIFTSQHWLAGNSFFTGERPLIYRFDEERPRRLVWIMRDRGARLAGRDAGHPLPARADRAPSGCCSAPATSRTGRSTSPSGSSAPARRSSNCSRPAASSACAAACSER